MHAPIAQHQRKRSLIRAMITTNWHSEWVVHQNTEKKIIHHQTGSQRTEQVYCMLLHIWLFFSLILGHQYILSQPPGTRIWKQFDTSQSKPIRKKLLVLLVKIKQRGNLFALQTVRVFGLQKLSLRFFSPNSLWKIVSFLQSNAINRSILL